jgi:hypothetical protein
VTQLLKVIGVQEPYSVQLLVSNTCMLFLSELLQDNRVGGSACQMSLAAATKLASTAISLPSATWHLAPYLHTNNNVPAAELTRCCSLFPASSTLLCRS